VRYEERRLVKPLEEKKTGINSSPSYTYRKLNCGLDISECCYQVNEMLEVLLFELKNYQLLKNASVVSRQLVRAICCAIIHAFSVVYRRTTALGIHLVLVLIQKIFVLNVYMSTAECPLFGDYGFGK